MDSSLAIRMCGRSRVLGILAVAVGCVYTFSCATPQPQGIFETPTYTGPARTFQTSFDSVHDFDGFYCTPNLWPNEAFGSYQEQSTEHVADPAFSHKAWISKANDGDNDSRYGYLPHRAYPTINFQWTPDGIYRTPCLITLYVWLDMTLLERPGHVDDWMSFVTLTPDASQYWVRTVLVNIEHDGFLHFMHVPNQGQQVFTYVNPVPFTQGAWHRLDVFIDYDAAHGVAVLWLDKARVCEADVQGGVGGLAQAHFGLYASAAVPTGTIYNDKLRIKEVADRTEAEGMVLDAW